MSDFLLRGLLKLLLIFASLSSAAQTDSSLTAKANKGPTQGDSILPACIKIAANPQLKGTHFSRSFVGTNYRDEWTTPVQVAVLNFSTSYGGLKPTKMGGGKQTKSLRVEDQSGQEWALRSVEKFPDKAIPPSVKSTVGAKIVEEGISGSYPYGILSMPPLSKAAGVLYLKNKLVYVADDPGLGEFREKFKNTLAFMEERYPSGFIEAKEQGKKEKTIGSEELVYKLTSDHHQKVDQVAILRARLLDNFIMDFDRHQGQWDWLGIDSAGEKIYYPVPTDRDQAFYYNGSTLGKIISGKNLLPQVQGFREKAKDISTFNKAAQSFDRYFLNGLSEEEWSRLTDDFLNAMTDSVLEEALHMQPVEIRHYSADRIIQILKNKRKYFKDDMMKYYRFLSATVSIVGTNERDQFVISKQENGKVSVVMYSMDSAGQASAVIYQRVFDPVVTKEIRIYGLEGDDKFVIPGGTPTIKIRIIGGPGHDEFNNNSEGRGPIVYDVNFEKNILTGNGSIQKRISGDPQSNNYQRLGYRYNKSGIGIAMEYTVGGLFLGPQLKIVKQGFRKEPFASSHTISITRAVDVSSYHLRYYGDFTHAFGKTDLLIRGDAFLPSSRTFFFGFGNNTVFDKTKGLQYYFDHYNLVNFSLMARSTINSWLQLRYGPIFQYFKLRVSPNEDKYVATVYPPQSDFNSQYDGKSFIGGELDIDINTKNNPIIPTRGIKLSLYGRALARLSTYNNTVKEMGGQLDMFSDFISKKRVVVATSFGAGHIMGNFELQQAEYLGFIQNLRGFRIDRFAGRSKAFNNSEIRFIKPNANLGLFRGAMGIFVFNDIGRVWADNEKSDTWHDGYGWGVFVAPLDKVIINAMLMYSNEEKNLLFVNFGFQF